ncbi:BT4734/BF3469 family protein [Spirosoma gilvum]
MATHLSAREVLNVEISCFVNYNTPGNPKPVNLYCWLTNTKYQSKVELLRQLTDKSKRDEVKSTLPAITPSGLFTYRQAASLIQHSGLLQFDIDQKENRHIRNYAALKGQIARLPFVAYCGLSVSGTGYWGIVPIAYPERHGQHFDALKRVFAHYGIILDEKPRNVASLRGYSYDPDGYFAEQVMLFELYDEPVPLPVRTVDYSQFQDVNDHELLTRLIRYVGAAGEGQRHAMLLKAARLAGGFIGAGRLDEQTAIYALESIASQWPMFNKSRSTIRDGIRSGQVAPLYPEERTTPLKIISKTCTQPTYKTYESSLIAEARIVNAVKTVIVSSEEELLAAPSGVIIRPDPALVIPISVEPDDFDGYPIELDEPAKVDEKPQIRQYSAAEYFSWQRNSPPFNSLGLPSLSARNHNNN